VILISENLYSKTSKLIGEGSSSKVYEAVASDGSKNYAWKQLNSAANDSDVERFQREIEILSTLDHDHIVTILYADSLAAQPSFVMPKARRNLEMAVKFDTNRQIDNIRIFKEICQGVIYAHQNGVLHRDLKPQNILLTHEDSVKVSDFGLARSFELHQVSLTRINDTGGTMLYAAPEQFNSSLKDVDERVDVYSLGKILYFIYTRQPPHHMDFSQPSLPFAVRYIVEKATNGDREKRFKDVATVLRRFLNAVSSETPSGSAEDRLQSLIAERQVLGTSEKILSQKIGELFLEQATNKVFFLKSLLNITPQVWFALGRCNWEMFHSVFSLYDEFVSDALPFEYTDKVADLYKMLNSEFKNRKFSVMVISRLCKMGYNHNRFYVRDTVTNILGELDSKAEIKEELVDFFDENKSAAEWICQRTQGLEAMTRLGVVSG